MKHLKKFEQYNNKKYVLIESSEQEPKSEPNFVFIVDQKDCTIEEKFSGLNEIKKHVDLTHWKEEFLISGCSNVYSWRIALYYNINNTNYIKIVGTSYGVAVKVNLISLEDFISVGLDGVENYFEMKKSAEKYNI